MIYRLLLASSLLMTGCANWYVPPEAKIEVQKNAARMDAYIVWMNAGRTTREQDQQLIRALRRAWHAQNLTLNDVPLPTDVEAWFANDLIGQNQSQTQPETITSSTSLMPQPLVPPGIDWSALTR